MLGNITRRTAAGSLALAAALAGVAYATIPASEGTVRACYAVTDGLLLGITHNKGDLRAVDEGEACHGYEKAISWSQQGLKGDPGPAGEQGPKGDTGPQGPATGGRAFVSQNVFADFSDGAEHEITRIDAPPGSYIASFSVQAHATSQTSNTVPIIGCAITRDGSTIGDAGETPANASTNGRFNGFSSLSQTGAFSTSTTSTVKLVCRQSLAEDDVTISASLVLHEVPSVN